MLVMNHNQDNVLLAFHTESNGQILLLSYLDATELHSKIPPA